MRVALHWVVVTAGAVSAFSASGREFEFDSATDTSSVQFNLSAAADLTGHSVRICGARNAVATTTACHSVLPADSSSQSVPGPAPGEQCPCFDLTSEGQLVDPTRGSPVAVTGLCPSSRAPSSDWKFDYTIYEGGACSGRVRNGEGRDLDCYDSHDLLTHAHPNSGVAALALGSHAHYVVCSAARAASKEWTSVSCVTATTQDDSKRGLQRYDCGCQREANVCSCGSLRAADLEGGCAFDHDSCDILCAHAM